MKKISKNFNLEDFLHSEQAQRYPEIAALQKKPSEQIVKNLTYLAEKTIQKIYDAFSYPITISSGYRCEALNKLVGSSSISQHVKGQAADISIPNLFLTDKGTLSLRNAINDKMVKLTGSKIKANCNANFYLFVFCVLNLDSLDIDQLIYEYGNKQGQPGWVHVSNSVEKNKRQILRISQAGTQILTAKDALKLGA
jgi:hypothetical protein